MEHIGILIISKTTFSCPCELISTRSKGSLKDHINVVHIRHPVKICKICNESFFTPKIFQRHLKNSAIHADNVTKTTQLTTTDKDSVQAPVEKKLRKPAKRQRTESESVSQIPSESQSSQLVNPQANNLPNQLYTLGELLGQFQQPEEQ